MNRFMFSLASLLLGFAGPLGAAQPDADTLLRQAGQAWRQGQQDRAIELAGKAIAADGKNYRLYLARGQMLAAMRKHAEAIADLDACLKLRPEAAAVYDMRGSEKFKLGKVADSITDFDRYIDLNPKAADSHWKRGISLFYAGKHAEGAKQFGAYEKIDTNDVENAIWHFLCNARAVGVDKARKQMLKIGEDKRVPMMEVYALFKGERKPADVLAVANAGEPTPEQRKTQLFYAHLYLGLYADVLGDRKLALEHMTQAAGPYRIGHYMGDVAKIHEDILRSTPTKKDNGKPR